MSLKNQLKNKYQQNAHFTLSCRTWLISIAILICLIANGISKTNAVPTDSTGGATRTHLLQRALRDVAAIAASLVQEEPKDTRAVAMPMMGSLPPTNGGGGGGGAAATLDETSSSSQQPQGQCLLDGVLVAETTVFCEKQVGCRAIQKTGHCCPDYKCDCEKDGKTYSNGDKLVDPETPCTVCYCQGGEILCSSVTCFHRDDCTPKYIAGRCCPEYDNCPISNPDPNNTNTNKTNTDELNAPMTNNNKPDVPAMAMNPKITIKEITKPTEIRITDENKPIPIHQMLKPSSSTTEAPTTTTTAAAPTTTTTSPTPIPTTAKATVGASDDLSSMKISPMQENSSVEMNRIKPNGGVNIESLKLKASVAYASTEVALSQAKGDNSKFQQHDTQKIVMLVDKSDEQQQQFGDFGTAGLQRIENESANDSTSKVNIKREFLDVTEGAPTASTTAGGGVDEMASSEVILGNSGESTGNLLHNSDEAAEPDTAGSDNIYHIILTTDGPRMGSSTEGYLAMKGGSASTEGINNAFVDETNLSAEEFNMLAEQQAASNTTEGITNFVTPTNELLNQKQDHTTEGINESSTTSTTESTHISSSTTEGPPHQHHHSTDDDDIAMQIESNPAYPSLPEDDFSLREVNFPLSETDDLGEAGLKDESRSISGSVAGDALKSTKHLDDSLQQHMFSGEFGSGMLIDETSTPKSDSHSTSSTPSETFSTTAKIALLYSAEDTSAETAVSNSSDFHLNNFMKESENETGSGDSLEMEAMDFFMGGSGSGAGGDFAMAPSSMVERKQREPTTPRPKRKLDVLDDIDELGSASEPLSPADDPKLDVESLKLDENQDNDVIKTDAASAKSNILSVKTNVAQDKTVTDVSEEGVGVVAIGDQQGGGGERVQRLYLQRVY